VGTEKITRIPTIPGLATLQRYSKVRVAISMMIFSALTRPVTFR